MIEVVLQKRKALYKGEWGYFPNDPVSQEESNLVANDTEVLAKISSPKNLQMLKFIWALATKISESVEGLDDKDDGMEFLCVKARFMRTKLDPVTGKVEIARKSLSRTSNETLRRLIDRMIYVICSDILPGMKESDLRREIEAMVIKE